MKNVDETEQKRVSGAGSNNGNNGGGHGSDSSTSGNSSSSSSGHNGGGNHGYLGSNRGSGSQAYHFGQGGYDSAMHGGCVGGARGMDRGGKNHWKSFFYALFLNTMEFAPSYLKYLL